MCPDKAIPASTALGSYPLRARAPIGKRIPRLDKNRIANFYTPGQWEKVNLLRYVLVLTTAQSHAPVPVIAFRGHDIVGFLDHPVN